MPNGNVGTFHRGRIKLREENTDEFLATAEVWVSEYYEVHIRKKNPHTFGDDVDLWHLAVNTKEHEPIRDWRDLQEIKNVLCGKEAEGLELFPAESRLVDTRNQYHIWVLMEKKMSKYVRFPFGFEERNVLDVNPNGIKQRET